MAVIYEPKGKAREYAELAVNLYSGCDHGCLYCYAPACLRKSRESFVVPIVRQDIVKNIAKEADKYSGREVLLCFTCDPYQGINTKHNTTRAAIKLLHQAGVKVNILTKGGDRSLVDFDLLSKNKNLSKYGTTLTLLNDGDSLKYEPGAAIPQQRIKALKSAHELGIFTWASLEPVIDDKQTIEIIKATMPFVNKFKVGKLNHEKSNINWKKFVVTVKNLLEKNGVDYYIKKDLLAYL